MLVSSTDESRRFFAEAWRKRCAGEALAPLEMMVAEVIAAHPEYHALFGASLVPPTSADNPFLHLSLHIALNEQLQTDRPAGIRAIYATMKQQDGGDAHAAEHRIMTVLAETLWNAQHRGTAPDEAVYTAKLNQALT
ncbi:MAG: DUF1841 family protein [Gammaproteobacteria bacterium]|nr:DUF1841 family protein [Gammaproteobacteria bacterium]